MAGPFGKAGVTGWLRFLYRLLSGGCHQEFRDFPADGPWAALSAALRPRAVCPPPCASGLSPAVPAMAPTSAMRARPAGSLYPQPCAAEFTRARDRDAGLTHRTAGRIGDRNPAARAIGLHDCARPGRVANIRVGAVPGKVPEKHPRRLPEGGIIMIRRKGGLRSGRSPKHRALPRPDRGHGPARTLHASATRASAHPDGRAARAPQGRGDDDPCH